jgi:hypothetical protein
MALSTRPAALGLISLAVAFTVAFLAQGEAEATGYYLRFPWSFGKQAYITQGYNGSSHQNGDYYALDIDVEWGGTLGDISAAA